MRCPEQLQGGGRSCGHSYPPCIRLQLHSRPATISRPSVRTIKLGHMRYYQLILEPLGLASCNYKFMKKRLYVIIVSTYFKILRSHSLLRDSINVTHYHWILNRNQT